MKRTQPNQPFANVEQTRTIQWSWLLLGLIAAAALLLFRTVIDFGPGRLICGLILLHFLPGVTVAVLLRRRDPLETAIFGLALSPLVITLLVYVSGFLLHLPLPAAIAGSGLLLAVALAWPRRREGPLETPLFEWPSMVPPAFGLLLILLTAAYYLHEPAHMLTVHGLYHSSGISQITTGLMPPDNIHLYGHSPGYQWPAWIAPAVSSLLTGISPPLSAALLRFLTFLGLFGLGYLLARDLGQKPAGRAFSGLLAVLGMNLFGGLLYLFRLFLSPDLRQAVLAGAANPGLQQLLTPEIMAAHLRPRTGTIIIKLVKFSFIIPGYVAVMIAILGAVRVFQGKKGGYLLIYLGTATALLIHPVLAVILALPFPLALLLTQLFKRREDDFPLVRLLGVALCLVFAALPALPYLLPAMQSAGEEDVTPRLAPSIAFAIVWLYFPLGLAAAPAALRAFRERNRQGIFIVLLAATIALFILVQRVKCDWYHLYMLSIPLGLLAGDQIGRWFHRLPGRVWPAALATALGLLVLLGPGLRLHIFSKDRRYDEGRYRFSGSSMITLQNQESDLARAYGWIRQETAPEAVLLEKPKVRNYEELSALTGRRVYVGRPTSHSPGEREGEGPVETATNLTRLLLKPGTGKQQALKVLAALPDPVYLFLQQKDLKGKLAILAAEYAALPEHVRLELDLGTVKIYRVLPFNSNAI